MAKLKLPFELEKPSSNEYVTQASQIGHNGGSLETTIDDITAKGDDFDTFIKGNNLFNKDSSLNVIGKLLKEDGSIVDAPLYAVSGKIAVSPNTSYCFSRTINFSAGAGVCYYSEDGTLVGTATSGTVSGRPHTSPQGAVYAILGFPKSALDTIVFEEGETMEADAKYKEYSLVDAKEDIEEIKPSLSGAILRVGDVEAKTEPIQIIISKNIYTGENEVFGYFSALNTFVDRSAQQDWKTTDYIKVEGGNNYVLSFEGVSSKLMFCVEYDSNQTPIKYTQTAASSVFTTDENTMYIRFGYKPPKENIQFEKGNAPTSYVPYSEKEYFNGDTKKALSDKTIMLFGDSLTAGSTSGIISFAYLIADRLNLPYRAFVLDRNDGNTDDVDIDYPSVTNYAKDGTYTCMSTRVTPDSVVERIERHILSSTNVDYVLIECCVNDGYSSLPLGTISETYDDVFNKNTVYGAIEEICQYLSTLNKDLKFGFILPWRTVNLRDDFYNGHIAIFEKWCVPYLDLRNQSGFNLKKCVAHQVKYSIKVTPWSATKAYTFDAKVSYEGKAYRCKSDNTPIGTAPTNDEYWLLVNDIDSDGLHLNSIGHSMVVAKIYDFLNRL